MCFLEPASKSEAGMMEAVILLTCANHDDQAHDCLTGTVVSYDWMILLS